MYFFQCFFFFTIILKKQRNIIKLGEVKAKLKAGHVNVSNLALDFDLHFPEKLMNLEAKIFEYKAVVTHQAGKLAKLGDSVRIEAGSLV